MLFITPYIFTYLCFFSFSYLIGTYAFIHQHICDLYQFEKTHLGLCNGLMALVSTAGVIIFLLYTIQIKKNIVTFFTWGSMGLMLGYCLIVLSSVFYQKAPKPLFYLAVTIIGLFRSIDIQCLLIMLKMHKDIYDRSNKISEKNYKFLTNIWSASFGMVVGFFTCNWLQYTLGARWEVLVIIGVSLKLLTTTLLFFGLREYLETEQYQHINTLNKNPVVSSNSKGTILTLSSFLTSLNSHLPSKLFLINSTLLDALHIGFCYALPVFFYESGYKGNQGYLTALYSLSIIAGTYVLAISDYFLQTAAEKAQQQDKKMINENSTGDRAVYLFLFSVSLFFFLIALVILCVFSFQTAKNKKNGINGDGNVTLEMILMCALGFFFGGPLKSYFSHKTIKAMGNLQKECGRRLRYDELFKAQESRVQQQAESEDRSFWDKILGHKLQISSSLITANRIATFFMSFVFLSISFYLVDKYLPYTMVFFTVIGLLSLVFDVIQNWILVKEEQKDSIESQKNTIESQMENETV